MPKHPPVRFRPAADLSLVHAAFVVATGGVCIDQRTEAALMAPTSEINTRLASLMVDVRGFWSRLFAAVAEGQGVREACEPALAKSGCSEMQVDPAAAAIASRLDECRIAFQSRYPKLGDQLNLRAGPLRDRWQTYGPGLLIETAKLIWSSSPPEGWWPDSVDCLLVQPVRGGDGGYDSGRSRVWIEAVLTDNDPQISEVYRLAFWITQVAVGRHLDSTLGRSDDPSHPEDFGSGTHRRSSLPWRLGCVPVILAAAVNLELISGSALPIGRAVAVWGLGDEATGKTVADWWQQWRSSETAMPVGLKTLKGRLESANDRPHAGHSSGHDAADR